MIRLSNIRHVGRYLNPNTGTYVNVKKGTNKQRGTDHYFYLYMNKRQYIGDADFFNNWKKEV